MQDVCDIPLSEAAENIRSLLWPCAVDFQLAGPLAVAVVQHPQAVRIAGRRADADRLQITVVGALPLIGLTELVARNRRSFVEMARWAAVNRPTAWERATMAFRPRLRAELKRRAALVEEANALDRNLHGGGL